MARKRYQGIAKSMYNRVRADSRASSMTSYPMLDVSHGDSRFVLKCLAALTLVIFLIACGGGSSPNINTVGPTAILNGSSLADASSHWVSTNCVVKVELTSDGGFISAVTDTSGSTTMTSGTWTVSGSDSAAATGASVWVNGLTNISGSTSSQAFSAQVGVYDSYQQNLGTCNFGLQSGGLTFP